MAMRRTTIMADEVLLDALREIARREKLSLGEVIRQGLEWRVKYRRRVPSFLGKIAGDPPHDTSERVDEYVAEAIRERHARY